MMKLKVELPVVQVAHMQTVDDLGWFIRSLQSGTLFAYVDDVKGFYSGEDEISSLKVSDGGDSVVWISKFPHPFRDGYQVEERVLVSLNDFIIWNQGGHAFVVNCGTAGVFNNEAVPDSLLKNVVVR